MLVGIANICLWPLVPLVGRVGSGRKPIKRTFTKVTGIWNSRIRENNRLLDHFLGMFSLIFTVVDSSVSKYSVLSVSLCILEGLHSFKSVYLELSAL